MIQFDSVSKVFRTGKKRVAALRDICLAIPTGTFAAVRGHSGCGKSTLLSLAGGLALPTEGDVTVAGETVSAMSGAQRAAFRQQSIGYVFQIFHLLPYLDILSNVLVASMPERRTQNTKRARQLLKQFGLADRLDHRPGQLSIGERQRVAMARALLNEPQVLLADEPTGNLDPRNADVLLDTLDEFHRDGGTVLLVTHDDRASARASMQIELESGQLKS